MILDLAKVIVDDPAKQRLEWTRKIESAKLRVDHQARSEAILGYTESSLAYRELLEELNAVKWWVLGLHGGTDQSPS